MRGCGLACGHAGRGAGCGVRRPGADDQAVRRVRRRRRRRAHRQERRLRLRVLQARGDVRAGAPRSRCGTRTATSSSPVCSSCSRRSARSIPTPSASRPTPARSMPTSSSSRSAPICTPRRRPDSSRAATSSTPTPARSRCATCWPTSTAGACIVAVTSTPFKCPPAPSETALLMHDFLTDRGLRDRSHISLVMPLPVPIPPSPDASKALLAAFAERGIDWHPQTLVRQLDPARRVAMLGDGAEMPYDLFLGVPAHRVPEVVARIGHDRRRLDPGRPDDPRDAVPRRVRSRRRHQRRHAEGRGVRGGPGRGRGRRHQRASFAARANRRTTTGAASATWSSATTRSPRSTSRSRAGRHRTARSKARRPRSPPTRPSSAPVACSAGSGAPGPEPVTRRGAYEVVRARSSAMKSIHVG